MDAVSPEAVKMVCGLCHKLLKRKPCVLESALSSSDVSVVAVLVCGHAYHADCLETRTLHEDRRDPPCPLCLGPHSHSGPPVGQEWLLVKQLTFLYPGYEGNIGDYLFRVKNRTESWWGFIG